MAIDDSYTKLLLHMDGTNASTTFTDEAGNTVTAIGNAQISTAQKKFGTASGLFDGTGDYLSIPDSDDWDFWGGDFTVDFWVYPTSAVGYHIIYWHGGTGGVTSSGYIYLFGDNSSNCIQFGATNAGVSYFDLYPNSYDIPINTWTHVALVKGGTTIYYFINGVRKTPLYGTQLSGTMTTLTGDVHIGDRVSDGWSPFVGNIDEFRISKGIARWTNNFIPPVASYRSSSNIKAVNGLAIENIKTINEHSATWIKKIDGLNFTQVPAATWFGERGIGGGGWDGVQTETNIIEYINISSLSNAKDFGDLTIARWCSGGCSDGKRGVFYGGYRAGYYNDIDYITIATAGNATDFGDSLTTDSYRCGVSDTSRGVFGTGYNNGAFVNNIEYITFATTANSQDFGDATIGRITNGAACNSIRGVWNGGQIDLAYGVTNTIDYITIATLGNAADFGDNTVARLWLTSCSNNIRGIATCSNSNYVIDYITIATTGNATNFGSMSVLTFNAGSCANGIRATIYGGYAGNVIQYITFSTLGNTADFGDLTYARSYMSGCSGN